MTLSTLLLCAFSLALLSYGWPEASKNHNSSDLLSTCNQIAAAISNASQVFFPCERIILSSDPNLMGDQLIKLHLSISSTSLTLLWQVPRRPLAQWSLALLRM
jgi:hypothetical protein